MKRHDGSLCHVYAIKDCDLVAKNAVKCTKWCKELHSDNPDWNCYHQEFLNKDCVEALHDTG